MATVAEERVEVRAQARWVRSPARKARLVLDLIRGRSVPEARSVLTFSTRGISGEIEKVLRSAVANAEQNHGLIGEELYVSACYADEGPTLKRWQARARGRAGRIHKGSCHITVLLSPVETDSGGRKASKGRAAVSEVTEAQPRRRRVRKQPGAEAPVEPTPAEEKPAAKTSEPKAPRRVRAPRAKKETTTDTATPKAGGQRRVTRKKKEETE
ncbi:MAG: 50S ribosomal protein L22 [Thermoleophilaceae bacterium]